jgi:soluble lytic murein transglycosylase-like protein
MKLEWAKIRPNERNKMKKIIMALFMGLVASCTTIKKVEIKPTTPKAIILASANAHGVPRNVILHVAKKESNFRCSTKSKYKGPLQISTSSARALGYKGKGGLDNCGAGLEYGMRHLALCVRKVGNNPRSAAKCHANPGAYGVRLIW